MNAITSTPASPWESGCCESLNSKLRDELPTREIFYDLREAKVLIDGRGVLASRGQLGELLQVEIQVRRAGYVRHPSTEGA